jgi:hypothetical protein
MVTIECSNDTPRGLNTLQGAPVECNEEQGQVINATEECVRHGSPVREIKPRVRRKTLKQQTLKPEANPNIGMQVRKNSARSRRGRDGAERNMVLLGNAESKVSSRNDS